MQEYDSDELASNSEVEKKIWKAKLSAEKKRKESKGSSGNASKKFKSAGMWCLQFISSLFHR